MAKQDQIQPSGVLKGEGQDESNPIMFSNKFFKTNGLRIQFGNLERIEGKQFIVAYEDPITAIHSNLNDLFWVQTSTTLYMVNSLSDIPEP